MKKGKAITLLSIISVVLAFLLVVTFLRCSVGLYNYKSLIGSIALDYDLTGGVEYTLTLSGENVEEVKDVDEVIETLEKRIESLGYESFRVKAIKDTDEAVKDYDIRIELENKETVSSDIEVITSYGKVKLFGGTSTNPTEEILEDIEVIKGSEYLGVFADQTNTQYGVAIKFTEQGYDALMNEIETAEANGDSYYLSIKLVGETETELWPGTSSISSGAFQNKTLNGYLTNETLAKQLALQIGSGGLDYQYIVSSGATISSPYGENVPTKIAIAIGVILALIMLVFAIAYRGFGKICALAILCFMQLEIIMLIAVPGVILSMGGVVGIVCALLLTSFFALNVSRRVKEECESTQKTVKAAVKKAFASTLIPTTIASVIAGVVALLLFFLASGLVKGFAITFGIGVVVGYIASVLLIRMFTALIFPLIKNHEKFLGLKREA